MTPLFSVQLYFLSKTPRNFVGLLPVLEIPRVGEKVTSPLFKKYHGPLPDTMYVVEVEHVCESDNAAINLVVEVSPRGQGGSHA